MIGVDSTLITGNVKITAHPPGSVSAEEWAKITVDKILSISDNTQGVARHQALAFKSQLETVLAQMFGHALSQQKEAIASTLDQNGLNMVAASVRASK